MTTTINNSIQLVGNTGKDVILTTFQNGNTKATLILAVNEKKVNEKGENIKKTVWYKIIAWGRMAKDVAAIAKKGSLLKVSGKCIYKNTTDISCKNKNTAEIVMTDFLKITKKPNTVTAAAPF